MTELNDYLQELVSASGSELHLEPNKNAYVVTSNGNTNVSDLPLPGPQINSMIFTLIPAEVKKELPDSPQVEFVHTHNLGNFNFLVKKSPSGFIVTISPSENISESASNAQAEIPQIQQFESSSVNDDSSENYSWTVEHNRQAFPNNDVAVEELVIEHNSPLTNPSDSTDKYARTVETLSTGDYAFESSGEDVSQDNVTEDFSDYSTDSNSTPQMQQTQMQTPVPPTPPPAIEQSAQAAASAVQANPQARAKIDALFHKMAEMGASDLHISVSVSPMVRKDGKMVKLDESQPPLMPDAMKQLLQSIMPQKNIKEFAERKDTDFAYEIKGLARFRANIFMDRKGMGGVFRIIPSEILTAEKLGLSRAIMDLCELSKGLVVVTGPTGSGKSTTLCAMVDAINKKREDHIITIEDPIEFTHENQKCLVNQREVHNHTDSFKDALRAALREDPDILLVGEMRDLETVSIAIETAETGHLVFGTLHTTTAASTVDRIIDQFPADRQQQVRVMLSESLRGVIAQTLLPKIGGGRIAALEVLIVTPAISNLIREGKTFQIPSAMQTGKNKGMIMLNDALMELVNKGLVEPRDAYIKAVDKTGFDMLLQRSGKSL